MWKSRKNSSGNTLENRNESLNCEVPISFIKATFGPYLLTNTSNKDIPKSDIMQSLNKLYGHDYTRPNSRKESYKNSDFFSQATRNPVILFSCQTDSKEFRETKVELKSISLYVTGENFKDDVNNNKVTGSFDTIFTVFITFHTRSVITN